MIALIYWVAIMVNYI